MDEVDERLQQLTLEAQQHPPKSRARRLALTRLIQMIQESGRLSRRKFDTPQEVYEEALQEVWLYLCRKIETYNPAKGPVINWVNFVLKRRLVDAKKRYTKCGREYSLDAPINSSSTSNVNQSGTHLDRVAQPEDTPLPSQLVRRCLKEDSDGLFTSKHIKGHSQANFRTIALLYLDGKTWQETAVAVGLQPNKVSTVQSFYWRCCRYFADKIKEYLQE
ncbi:MAG: hypothetical protein F6K58_20560 [Symploca sp. SIO2E9]|nr:hypothetical protein [Symploca sp. SIO2E9]